MKERDQFLIDLLKEALRRTEYSKAEQKEYLEGLLSVDPASLRNLVTCMLSIELENLHQFADVVVGKGEDKGGV
ncbi:hypothetical protein C3007_07055 [Avibacterium gallinarum]|uniref:Uncharacterized protein n=1 Tax=Avibacterium gallinarum TaxID=755 RepID=A0A379AZT1_AVIGA|nr:hypothetical protein [Avibacterium gallinarum]POY44069.1 hypothetical protein C3007_07055 [Avibacterium gallinarum]TDP29129.1 hypothetical protein EV689_10345 [Avibacterium gallinarum]SUB28443.1 Uncharacterised protein [Avibacterium gallinarum]